jgi:integrase
VAGKLTHALSEVQQGAGLIADERLTVADFLVAWLDNSARPNVRPRTYQLYEMIVRRHLVPAIGQHRLTRLEPGHVQVMLNGLLDAGYAASTIRTVRMVLSRALKQALRWSLVGRNVATLVDAPRGESERPEPFTLAEVRELLAGVKGHRLEALVTVAVLTGMRKGEVLGLQWEDVDIDAATVRVSGSLQRLNGKLVRGEPKTAQSRRVMAVPPQVVTALKVRRRQQLEERLKLGHYWQDTGYAFTTALGTPLEPRNVNRDFSKLLQDLGLRHQRFHDLRHCFATLQLANHTPAHVVREQLGHSQISTTLDIYSHAVAELHRESAARFGELFA